VPNGIVGVSGPGVSTALTSAGSMIIASGAGKLRQFRARVERLLYRPSYRTSSIDMIGSAEH
jgi:hypothetical protein